MIHVKERVLNGGTIAVMVDGVLDEAGVMVLKDVFGQHLPEKRKVLLDLEGVVHVTREGIGFLYEIREAVNITNLPEFVKLETRARKI
ncbi:MAG: hypothetical protein DRH11_16375 [Deltaproteobacteria bacterium]|nr:hypothetical protein [Deltaproteobacteria bacterium]RLB29140.1 MAG: hypothetical protein DRH11_16375 [Deltaproteobacteria bacterium]